MKQTDIIYGKNSIEGVLEKGKRQINKIFLAKGVKPDSKVRKILSLAKEAKIPVQNVPREKIDLMAQGAHQGIAASVSPIEYTALEDFLQKLDKNKLSLIIILDGIEDPHNFGSIIRTAAAANVDGIVIPKRRSSQVTSTVEKASAGTVDKVPIVKVTNLANTIDSLKENNFWIIGTEGSADKYYFEEDFNMNCALVAGSEDKGISSIVKKKCDLCVKIPMPGNIDSLNVANASSIIIYEIVRQRILKNNI